VRPRALVLQAPGTNREHDAAQALELAGAAAEVVPLQALLERAARWEGYRILVIPGGFSHGDALGAGRLLGLDLDARLHDEVHAFVDAGWPVLGICNGFQALLRAGILPGVPDVEVTLAPNRSGLFECRWVHLRTERTRCVWTHDVDSLVHCPVAHGEGAMVTSSPGMERLMAAGLVALRYVRGDGTPAGTSYPHNPSVVQPPRERPGTHATPGEPRPALATPPVDARRVWPVGTHPLPAGRPVRGPAVTSGPLHAGADEVMEGAVRAAEQDGPRSDPPGDKPREQCGVVGVSLPAGGASRVALFGLLALQHRGQEAAGMAVTNHGTVRVHKGLGLVERVFSVKALRGLPGRVAVAHTRYGTTGRSTLAEAQPVVIQTPGRTLALAHNGHLVNAALLRREAEAAGEAFTSTSDSEVMAVTLARGPGTTAVEWLRGVMPRWVGAYSIVVMWGEEVLAARDPWGFRPLVLGRFPGGGHAVASETCALATLGCEVLREIRPGEVVSLNGDDVQSTQAMAPATPLASCAFESIYFSRADSTWGGQSLHQVRQRLGEGLARESPVEADVVVPVPDSSVPAALGYARASGIPLNDGFFLDPHVGRTFIEPTAELRQRGVAMKYHVVGANVAGRRVVMVDDSVVRGTTAALLVRLLREAGAREVHLRIGCPPVLHPCFMGVHMATHAELLAHRLDVDGMAAHFGCDSLRFLSLTGLRDGLGPSGGHCLACFTGAYPFPVDDRGGPA
jgi:amidophosphoribosyltransferase